VALKTWMGMNREVTKVPATVSCGTHLYPSFTAPRTGMQSLFNDDFVRIAFRET